MANKCLLLLLLCVLLSSSAVRGEDSLALLNKAMDVAGKAKQAEENVVNTVTSAVNKAHEAAASAVDTVSSAASHTRSAVDKTKQTMVNATETTGGKAKAYANVSSGSTIDVGGPGLGGLLVAGWLACLMMGSHLAIYPYPFRRIAASIFPPYPDSAGDSIGDHGSIIGDPGSDSIGDSGSDSIGGRAQSATTLPFRQVFLSDGIADS
ncbi:hypothetical protein LINGRAHAP2_LOCUS25246 [Linum grandiflorum]